MRQKTSVIPLWELPGKELLIIIGVVCLVSIIGLGWLWFENGTTAPEEINMIETTNVAIPVAAHISHISVKDITHESATVLWQTDSALPATLQFGLQEDALRYSVSVPSGSLFTLAPLFPKTRYFFRIISGGAVSETYSFVTN